MGFSESSPFEEGFEGMKDLKAVRDKGLNSIENATGGEKFIIKTQKGQESHFHAVGILIFVH